MKTALEAYNNTKIYQDNYELDYVTKIIEESILSGKYFTYLQYTLQENTYNELKNNGYEVCVYTYKNKPIVFIGWNIIDNELLKRTDNASTDDGCNDSKNKRKKSHFPIFGR